jgi:diketogulonate reductase-like aldo/keto reductase
MTAPALLYGTAWKEDETERLTLLALSTGFRGVDTANQRKHYHEAAVGAALATAVARGIVTRAQLFLQTKFTSIDGQDHRLPYDRGADRATQVRQSFARSLEHLRTDYVDSYVLHGPSTRSGFCDADVEVWRAMEELADSGRARKLGVSNVALDQLEALYEIASVTPSFVQNRCYARTGWDAEVRTFCRKHGIVYQGFSLLTANRRELARPAMATIAARLGCTVEQVVFAFAVRVGMQPLTGTSQEIHMRLDLAAPALALSDADLRVVEAIGRA